VRGTGSSSAARTTTELVANLERHIAEAHAELVGRVSCEDILAAVNEA